MSEDPERFELVRAAIDRTLDELRDTSVYRWPQQEDVARLTKAELDAADELPAKGMAQELREKYVVTTRERGVRHVRERAVPGWSFGEYLARRSIAQSQQEPWEDGGT